LLAAFTASCGTKLPSPKVHNNSSKRRKDSGSSSSTTTFCFARYAFSVIRQARRRRTSAPASLLT
jgi:hypothetical protein